MPNPLDTIKQGLDSYGNRPNGTKKGQGYFGPLPMTDGSGKVATEITHGYEVDGQKIDAPALVPTLSEDEKNHLLSGKPATEAIHKKAVDHAMKRIKEGKSPYAD